MAGETPPPGGCRARATHGGPRALRHSRGTHARHSRGVPPRPGTHVGYPRPALTAEVPAPGTHVGYPRTPWAEHTLRVRRAVHLGHVHLGILHAVILVSQGRSRLAAAAGSAHTCNKGAVRSVARAEGAQPSSSASHRLRSGALRSLPFDQPTAAEPPESPGNVLSEARRPMSSTWPQLNLIHLPCFLGRPHCWALLDTFPGFLQATYLGRALGVSMPSSDPS